MHLDVIDLREFYNQPIGAVARRLIARRIRARWPDLTSQSAIGIGYASPYLTTFRGEARTMALMPAPQGVVHWPRGGPNATALVEADGIPLADAAADRVLAVHSLEMSDAAQPLLREVWRVLAPGGRLIAVVPNRRGLWARVDTTPFGHGRPYSRDQITDLLRQAMFQPTGWAHALYMPPMSWRPLVRSATAWERLGEMFWPAFSGVIIVEAVKQVYAPVADSKRHGVKARTRPRLAVTPSPRQQK